LGDALRPRGARWRERRRGDMRVLSSRRREMPRDEISSGEMLRREMMMGRSTKAM